MRRIRIRGKRLDNGEWAYGYLYLEEREGTTSYFKDGANNKNLAVFVVPVIQVVDEDGMITDSREVLPATVGQFTGLQDKNGAEIYEGDIWKESRSIGVIRYRPGEFYVDWVNDRDYFNEHLNIHAKYGEVIGNVYTNPDLLGGE